jgi:hypothetical protein
MELSRAFARRVPVPPEVRHLRRDVYMFQVIAPIQPMLAA